MADNILTPGWRDKDAARKSDRRSRKTRAALVEALMALLREKPLESITVTELAERADVNRATFYTHFQDVYDMFAYVREEFCGICSELVDAHAEEVARDSYDGLLHDLFEYFAANEDVFSVLTEGQAGSLLFDEITALMHARFIELVAPLSAIEEADARLRGIVENNRAASEQLCAYEFAYMVGGVVNVLKSWFGRGRKEPIDLMVNAAKSFIGNPPAVLRRNLLLLEEEEPARAKSAPKSGRRRTQAS